MKIYELIKDDLDKTVSQTCYIDDKSAWYDLLKWNVEKLESYPKEPVPYGTENNLPLDDFPHTYSSALIVSDKLLNIFKRYSTNIQYFPAEVYRKEKLLSNNYYAIIFTKDFPIINKWKSKKARGLMIYDKLVLSKKKLTTFPSTEKLFIIKDVLFKIYIFEEVKNEIEAVNLKGIDFKEIEIL